MKIIVKFLAVVLISMAANVVNAQTSKKDDVAQLSASDSVKIVKVIAKNQNLWDEDKAMVLDLLKQKNKPEKGVIIDDGEFVRKAQKGDDWTAYISNQHGSYWLTYVVRRKDKFVGRIDVRLE